MKRILMFSGFMFLGISQGVCEATEITHFEPIVVEAARSETDYRKLPAAVDVVTSETLEIKAKTGNFYDAVKNVVGVHTDHGSGMGWPTIKVRGETPTVLLNGININPYVTASPFNILSADTDAVERIEILKGSQAATQGSGSMSGVINVIMKKGSADNPYVKVRVGGGSNDAWDGSATISGGKDKFAWFMNYSQKETGNFNTPKGTIPYTDTKHQNLYARFDFTPDTAQEISAEVMHSEGKYRTGGDNYYYINDGWNNKIWENKPDTTGLFLKYAGDFDRVNIHATGGYMKNSLDYVYGFAPYDKKSYKDRINKASIDENSYLADLKSRIKIIENDGLNMHLNYFHKTTDAKSSGKGGLPFKYNSTEHLDSFVGQLESKPIPHLLLLAGARHDMYRRNNNTESNTSPNVGLSIYPFAHTDYNWTTLWASYSEAFNMPAANYLHMPAMFGGNPDLKHEKSRGWEVGVKQQISRWAQVSTSYFHTDYRDRIVFDLKTFKLNNVGKSSTKGFEVELEVYPTEYLTLYTNYLKMKRKDKETGDRLYISPTPDAKWVFGALVHDFHGFNFSLEGSYFDDFKLDKGQKHPTEHKVVLDSRLSYTHTFRENLKIEPYVELNNITDEVVYCSGDTPGIQPGRNVFAGVGVTYNF